MAEQIKAKDAVPGRWYKVDGSRMLFINEVSGDYWFADIYSDQSGYAKDADITPLPDCTGWDWEPTPKHPPVPEGWRELGGDEEIKEGDRYCLTGEWKEVCNNIGSLRGRFDYPHIRRIEPTYRPFANAEEFKPHRDRWVLEECRISRVDVYCDEFVEVGGRNYDWPEACGHLKFDDGSPFGVEVKE